MSRTFQSTITVCRECALEFCLAAAAFAVVGTSPVWMQVYDHLAY